MPNKHPIGPVPTLYTRLYHQPANLWMIYELCGQCRPEIDEHVHNDVLLILYVSGMRWHLVAPNK